MYKKIKKAINIFGKKGGKGIIIRRAKGYIIPNHIPNYKKYQNLFRDKIGLEIGGPSDMFLKHGLIPIYPVVKRLDRCNFRETTIWEGDIKEGSYHFYGNKNGYQYIRDATDLSGISETYDFILSAHCLEHIANPLKAIEEWLKILKDDGILLIVVPNKKFTFDHKRPTTSFNHLLNDFQNNIKEDDLTHLPEILKLHDINLDRGVGDIKEFKERSLKNYENRCLHHHIFDTKLLIEIFDFFDIKIITIDYAKPHHIISFGRKKEVFI